MEKIRREIRLFWTRNGKSLLQIIGVIFLIISVIQGLNRYTILQNEEKQEKLLATQEQREKEKLQKEKDKDYKNIISTFINCCNNKDIEIAYNMLSKTCKQDKYSTVKEFEEKYINKIFDNKKDCKIILKENKIYKILLLEDILQSGTIENRKQVEDYYSIEEDVLGNMTININLYNSI